VEYEVRSEAVLSTAALEKKELEGPTVIKIEMTQITSMGWNTLDRHEMTDSGAQARFINDYEETPALATPFTLHTLLQRCAVHYVGIEVASYGASGLLSLVIYPERY
jgi:hypothetical protein